MRVIFSEANSTFVYSTAQERDELVAAERKFTDDKVRSIIDFKNFMCSPENGKNFVVINQKGIDPLSLDMLAKAGRDETSFSHRDHGIASCEASEHGTSLSGMWRYPCEQCRGSDT